MKKVFLKNIVAITIATMTVVNSSTVTAYAIWNKDSQNRWTWTENGAKSKGWKKIEGKWYYFDNNGIMKTGWIKVDGKWYHLKSSGAMTVGWLKDNDGKWYYLTSSGAMKTGWLKHSDGKWYYLSGSGAMITGWFKDYNGKWYYLSSSGSMITGWLDHNGSKYFLDSSGAMLTGRVTISGKIYLFSDSGALIKQESTTESDNTSSNEKRTGYIATQSGALNIRSEASASSTIIGALAKDTKVTVIGQAVNGFYKISTDSIEGWASSDFITFEKPTSPSVNPDNNNSNNNIILGPIRTTPPSTSDRRYYSDDNIFYRAKYAPPYYKSDGSPILGNCTWYAWGRIWELTGKAPLDAGFTGNAYEWWGANNKSGKYKTGYKPKVGALAVWKSSLSGSGGFGHVAIVEKIENNKIYISESSWHGFLFKYREIYNTNDLYGYIYIDEPNY